MKKKWVIAVIVVLVIAGLSSVGFYWETNNYVAKVAGERITKPEFEFFLASVKNQMENSGNSAQGTSKDAIWNSKIDGKDAKTVAKDKALDEVKKYKIQIIKAKERNISVDNNDILKIENSITDAIKKTGGKVEAEKRFIETYRVGIKDYTSIMKKLMFAYKFMQEEEKNIKVTPEEIKDNYEKNFENEKSTTVRHILFSTVDDQRQPLPEDKQAEAKNKAEEILKKVEAGEDFASLAKQYSEDPGSKDNAGEYTFGKGQMVAAFEGWSFKAKAGDTGIVKSEFGYHVMKKPTLTELEAKIKENVIKDKYDKQLEQWMNDPQYDLKKNQKVFDKIKVV